MEKESLEMIIYGYRIRKGVTMKELAKKCGISISHLCCLENGYDSHTGEKIKPTMEMYEKLARGMEMTRDELISRVEGKPMFTKRVYVDAKAYHVPLIDHDAKPEMITKLTEEADKRYVVSEKHYKPKQTLAYSVGEQTDHLDINNGDICIIWQNEELSDKDLVLVYDNERGMGLRILYDSKSNDDIMIIGKVIGIQRDLIPGKE